MSASQAGRRGFDPRLPLRDSEHKILSDINLKAAGFPKGLLKSPLDLWSNSRFPLFFSDKIFDIRTAGLLRKVIFVKRKDFFIQL